MSALALDTVPWFRKLAAMPVSSHVTNFKYKYNAGKLQVSKQGKQMMIKTVQLLYLYYCHRSLYEHHQHLQTALNLSLYCQLPTQTHTHTHNNKSTGRSHFNVTNFTIRLLKYVHLQNRKTFLQNW